MSPEERSMRVTDAILDLVLVDGENVSASVLHPAQTVIADAIRDAENAVLELACAASSGAILRSVKLVSDHQIVAQASCDAIRSIKTEDRP